MRIEARNLWTRDIQYKTGTALRHVILGANNAILEPRQAAARFKLETPVSSRGESCRIHWIVMS